MNFIRRGVGNLFVCELKRWNDVTHEIRPNEFFKWQGSYSAFTVSRRELDSVDNYIQNQATHHQKKSLIPVWELSEN
ncbi:MAG: hypothetical protein WBB29_09600 [Geitlerinemataceae cyanobacterium]